MSMERITIGTRGSALARKQVDLTIAAIRVLDTHVPIDVRVIQTEGDLNQNPIPLDTIGKGWFTKEIERALLTGEIDIAVHSLKDMAEDMPVGLHIGAYLPREDARDALITRDGKSLESLRMGAVIGTDSARRHVQMRALRPDVQMKSMRGNVPTRIEKLQTEPYDAIILAAAGLKRLGLEDRITHYFDPLEMTPSPGQGIIALQIRDSDTALQEILNRITDVDTEHVAHIERSYSRAVGGGCKSPTGAYAFRVGDQCQLITMHIDAALKLIRIENSAPWNDSRTIGVTVANRMLDA